MRPHLPRLAATLLALCVGSVLAASEDAWRVDKDEHGIRIESRAVPGWEIREIRGTTTIAAPLGTVAAVVTDVAALPKLNTLVREARITERSDATHYRVYAAMDMPWPVSDRDLINQRVISQDPATGSVSIEDTAVADAPERKGYVRIVQSHHLWRVTPAANGQVNVEMRLLSNPRGLPATLVNALAVSSPFETLTHLHQLVQDPQYAHAKPEFLATPAR